MGLKVWFLETRPQFLILSIILAFLGTSIAWYNNSFNLCYALLAGFGLVLTHASVNIINDYFDYKSGIDLAVKRTPFSGGSGILPAGMLTPKQALWFGSSALIIAIPIGIYFIIVSGWQLLPLLLIAAFFIILYSPFILKRLWPEWSAGVGLGVLPILGLYFVQTGVYTWQAVVASIPSFFLVHNLLLLNEFPDTEADIKANRKTLPLTMGKKKAAIFYTVVAVAVYVWIFAWTMARVMPVWTLLALLTIPLAIKAINGVMHNDDPSKLMPGMAANVMMVLSTQFLIGIGFILGRIF
jgi:1,4-dihydroxy-2-naphthoate polyprenyltransferase